MKIVAMIGGLGAQIMQYMFLMNIRESVSDEEILIDTSRFSYQDIWNGYELEKIFHIREKDIWEEIREKKRGEVINSTEENTGTSDVVLQYCYHHINRNVVCYYKSKKSKWDEAKDKKYGRDVIQKRKSDIVLVQVKRIRWLVGHVLKNLLKDYGDSYAEDYLRQPGVTYYDDFSHISDKYLYKNKVVLRRTFLFLDFCDERNQMVSEQMLKTDSVAVHVRRSDHMYDNGSLFRRGYFKCAVQYMKKKIKNPYFYIFSEDIIWCKNNIKELGINDDDCYLMVDWNTGRESYRDMQLMTYCKNNILVMSAFSWCGYYLSVHDKKTVIAPKGWWLEVPIHM